MPITATVTRGFTYDTGVEVSSASLNRLGEPTVSINESDVDISGGTISGLTSPISIADGGTGATTASAARTALNVDQSGTDNSTNVTLSGTPDYLTISGQEITRNPIDLSSDVTGLLPNTSINGLGTISTQESNSVTLTGGSISGVLITLPSYNVASLPTAGTAGRIVYCTDGDSGTECLAVDNGTDWKRVSLGATVSAT
jgi:hypothetical protein